jgi:hypothetical protein
MRKKSAPRSRGAMTRLSWESSAILLFLHHDDRGSQEDDHAAGYLRERRDLRHRNIRDTFTWEEIFGSPATKAERAEARRHQRVALSKEIAADKRIAQLEDELGLLETQRMNAEWQYTLARSVRDAMGEPEE